MGFGVRKSFLNKSKLDGKGTTMGFTCCKECVECDLLLFWWDGVVHRAFLC
jgi:hypothetical protein